MRQITVDEEIVKGFVRTDLVRVKALGRGVALIFQDPDTEEYRVDFWHNECDKIGEYFTDDYVDACGTAVRELQHMQEITS